MVDLRFDVALFTPSEVADHLWVARSTLRDWLGIVAEVQPRAGSTIPFAGLVEALVVRNLRRAGLKLEAIREANDALQSDLGVPHPLIWRDLKHDGTDILRPIEQQWTRARDRQPGIPGLIELGLEPVVTWADDRYPSRLRLDTYTGCTVIVDPRFSGGSPILEDSGVRVADVLNMVKAGDSLNEAAEEFGLAPTAVQALILADWRRPHAA